MIPNSDARMDCLASIPGEYVGSADLSAPLVLSYTVPRASGDAPYRQLRGSFDPDALVGTYIKSTWPRPLDVLARYPFECLPSETFYPHELLPADASGATFYRLDNATRRTYFATRLVTEAREREAELLILDGGAHPMSGAAWAKAIGWPTVCQYYRQVRDGCAAHGIDLIVNFALSDWLLTPGDCDLLTQCTHAVALEYPLNVPYCRNPADPIRSVQRFRDGLARWRQILDAGVGLVLTPTAPPGVGEQRFLAAAAMLVRRPGDRLFVLRDWFNSIPEWRDLAARLGAAQGAYTAGADPDGPLLTRSFERGVVTVWPLLNRERVSIES